MEHIHGGAAEGHSGPVSCQQEACQLGSVAPECCPYVAGEASQADCLLQLRLRVGTAKDPRIRSYPGALHGVDFDGETQLKFDDHVVPLEVIDDYCSFPLIVSKQVKEAWEAYKAEWGIPRQSASTIDQYAEPIKLEHGSELRILEHRTTEEPRGDGVKWGPLERTWEHACPDRTPIGFTVVALQPYVRECADCGKQRPAEYEGGK